MTREHVKSMLPILQAYAEGKIIQFFGESGAWSDFAQKASPNFDKDPSRYRIKSNPNTALSMAQRNAGKRCRSISH